MADSDMLPVLPGAFARVSGVVTILISEPSASLAFGKACRPQKDNSEVHAEPGNVD